MKCFIETLTRPPATFSLKGEGPRRRPSPFRERVRVARVRVCLLAMNIASLGDACPLCKDNIPNGMAKGFFWSILLMLVVPALVVGVIAGVVWRSEQKKRDLPNLPRE